VDPFGIKAEESWPENALVKPDQPLEGLGVG